MVLFDHIFLDFSGITLL